MSAVEELNAELERARGLEASLNDALALAQNEFPPIPREKTVQTGKYSFSYAPLETILAAVRPVLAKHGLAIVQPLSEQGIRTELRHADGGVIRSVFPIPWQPDSPQQLGSMLTYLRRYALCAMLGIATEEDDDGASSASQATPKAANVTPGYQSKPRSTIGPETPAPLDKTRRGELFALVGELKEFAPPDPFDDWNAVMHQRILNRYGKQSVNDLTSDEAVELAKMMRAHLEALKEQARQDEDIPF
jgi:ERF superfamily